MFGGEFLTSFVPEVGVQEQMREHGKDPLWKIKYEQQNLLSFEILFSVGESIQMLRDACKWRHSESQCLVC